MADIVRCEICGRIFNARYIASHKRRAHQKSGGPGRALTKSQDKIQEILSLFQGLPNKDKKAVLDRLSAIGLKGN